jgi:hypothetical protein
MSTTFMLRHALLAAASFALASHAFAQAQDELAALAARAAVLEQEIRLIEDLADIERLQRTYGFYVDKQLWSQAADLFAASGTLEVSGRGVYVGRDSILAFLRGHGEEYPQHGRLFDQMQLMPIVHVAPDGQSAQGRWRHFAQEAVWQEYANWGTGVYENDYVKEDGVWKIASLRLYVTMYSPYEDGWGKTALADPWPANEVSPDRPPTSGYAAWPSPSVAPFHFPNPVSGGSVYAQSPADFAPAPARDARELEQRLTTLDHRIGLLEDLDRIERLHVVYGYYLAHNQWDDLAATFSSDGAIEIAQRGVYVGPASVRRNLNLYGEPGIHHGLLHNHMQFQPVIHVADDRQTARVRSRAFSMMGEHGNYSMWMGGVYENQYVKEDGIWKFRWDQVFNTYFVTYPVGWKNAVPRPPPGITESNPPDLPPSVPFEMYPSAFLPPFHYPNPVTGNAVRLP